MNFNLHVMSMDMQIHLHGLYMAVYNLWTGLHGLVKWTTGLIFLPRNAQYNYFQ